MTPKRNLPCLLLALILLTYVLLAAWYSLAIPLGERFILPLTVQIIAP